MSIITENTARNIFVPLIKIDEETFATVGGLIVSIVTTEFIDMASKYIPELNTIKTI